MGDQINHTASSNANARTVGTPSPLQKALEVFVAEWYFHDLKTSDAESEFNLSAAHSINPRAQHEEEEFLVGYKEGV